MQVAIDEVFELLQSESPVEPARALLGRILDDLRAECVRTNNWHPGTEWLEKSQGVLGGARPSPPPPEPDQPLVDLHQLRRLAKTEGARSRHNLRAASLIQDALAYRERPGPHPAIRGRGLLALFLAFSRTLNVQDPRALEGIISVIGQEHDTLSGLQTRDQAVTPQVLRAIVAQEVRLGVTAAAQERWSDETLSDAIVRFLENKDEAATKGKRIGSKHRQDIERRLEAFQLFIGSEKPVRDVTRDDLRRYRDVLDRLCSPPGLDRPSSPNFGPMMSTWSSTVSRI